MTYSSPFAWPPGIRAAVSFSFDDARASQLDVGMPILDRHGLRATFYVVPRAVETRQDDWRGAAARGHELGNHTVTHPCSGNFPWSRDRPLEELTLEAMAAEMDAASQAIEAMSGVLPRTFAYPCGQKFVGRGTEVRSYVPIVAERFLAGRGFRDEASNDPAFCDLAQLAGIDGDGLRFGEYLLWVERALSLGGWVCFASHDVGSGGRQTVIADEFDRFLAHCAEPQNGIWFDTVERVSEYVAGARV